VVFVSAFLGTLLVISGLGYFVQSGLIQVSDPPEKTAEKAADASANGSAGSDSDKSSNNSADTAKDGKSTASNARVVIIDKEEKRVPFSLLDDLARIASQVREGRCDDGEAVKHAEVSVAVNPGKQGDTNGSSAQAGTGSSGSSSSNSGDNKNANTNANEIISLPSSTGLASQSLLNGDGATGDKGGCGCNADCMGEICSW
jgi:cytoskeletal protein RodZ